MPNKVTPLNLSVTSPVIHRIPMFTVCIKSVPLYHFKLAYVALRMAVKEFFEIQF